MLTEYLYIRKPGSIILNTIFKANFAKIQIFFDYLM